VTTRRPGNWLKSVEEAVIAERTGKRMRDLAEAASELGLSPEAVLALVDAGFLSPSGTDAGGGPTFAASDLKGFLARNSEGGGTEMFLGVDEPADPKVLLEALDSRAEEMARRALEIFQAAVPDASIWSQLEQARFVEQARKRFEAILAVTGAGEEVDEGLVEDLQEVGASAAWAGSPLPELLVVLRISRDLVVQTAVEVAEERGRRWGLALSLLLTRVLPAMDRLTDALAQGYWSAIVGREEESRARYEHLVEESTDGVYEIGLDSCFSYVNPSLAAMTGRSAEDLVDRHLSEVFNVADGSDAIARLAAGSQGVEEVDFTVLRADGVRRELHVVTFPRRQEGSVVGYQGVVRDVTSSRQVERAKNEFLGMVTDDLRGPITTILGLGVTLEAYAGELPVERLRRTGSSIRRQAERISRLADDLYEVSRLEGQSLRLKLRPVSVAGAVEAALASLEDPGSVQVEVGEGVTALADARRLEQVLANLVENALVHGAAPVVVEATEGRDGVEVAVLDAGPGVPEALVPSLFSRLGAGMGLFLVRGLVEAMGGRVTYEPRPAGGCAFRLRLRRPPR
jgi:PAS domain S-box-containing protein